MASRLLFLVAFNTILLLFPLVTVNCLSCYQCDTKTNEKCNNEPGKFSVDCPSFVKGCFTRIVDANEMYRDCAVDALEHWRACEEETAMGCFFCKESDCNGHLFYHNATIKCVVCQGEQCKTETQLTTCTGRVYYGQAQYCFYATSDHTVVQKGCGPPHDTDVDKAYVMTLCQGSGCNMELPNSYSTCFQYYGDLGGFQGRQREICHNKDSNYWHPGCYHIAPVKNRLVESGCLSKLDTVPLRGCTKRGKTPHCQYCVGDKCNEHNQFNFTNFCQAPNDRLEYCSRLNSLCYVTYLKEETESKEIVEKIYAGCVETDLEPWLLSNQQTHFCDNSRSDEAPCMDILQDFTKRISCYVCKDCPKVFEMDHKIKQLCPLGTTQCYEVMSVHQKVVRGCFNPNDPEVGTCSALNFICSKCDYNYCNFHDVGPTNSLCYKTRPYQHHNHLMTMRLEDCMGVGLLGLFPDCYLGWTSDPFTLAGCTNELEGSDIKKLKSLTFGGMSVVNTDPIECYKCQSNQTDFCYNVRNLDPEECSGLQHFAIRGCYSLILEDSIQRGCLSELDLYNQMMCNTQHFQNICIMCMISGCNIDVP